MRGGQSARGEMREGGVDGGSRKSWNPGLGGDVSTGRFGGGVGSTQGRWIVCWFDGAKGRWARYERSWWEARTFFRRDSGPLRYFQAPSSVLTHRRASSVFGSRPQSIRTTRITKSTRSSAETGRRILPRKMKRIARSERPCEPVKDTSVQNEVSVRDSVCVRVRS